MHIFHRGVRRSTTAPFTVRARSTLTLSALTLSTLTLSSLQARADDAPPSLSSPVDAPVDAPPAPAEAPGVLVVLTDTPGVSVHIDGVLRGTTPLTVDDASVGAHTVKLTPSDMPAFEAKAEVFTAARTEFYVKLAEKRPGPDFQKKKADFDDAMFAVGWKTVGSLVACAGGAVGMSVAGVAALAPATNTTIIPLATAGIAGASCLSSVGLCGWAFVDMVRSPDEPSIPRVHVVKVTPPPGHGQSTLMELFAPPVDSDGKPLDGNETDEKDDDNADIVEAGFRY